MSAKHITIEEKHKKDILDKSKELFGVKNKMSAPKISKVVVNAGLGRKLLSIESGKSREELLNNFKSDLMLITGQALSEAKAKKSIASFKSREGMVIGLKGTIRGKRMNDFLDRLINFVFPRVRDFRGLSLSNVDKNGNLNIGIKEMIVFPEVPPSSSKNVFGLQITVVPENIKNREQAIEFYRILGFPLKKD